MCAAFSPHFFSCKATNENVLAQKCLPVTFFLNLESFAGQRTYTKLQVSETL